jgi:hypothetical protein
VLAARRECWSPGFSRLKPGLQPVRVVSRVVERNSFRYSVPATRSYEAYFPVGNLSAEHYPGLFICP